MIRIRLPGGAVTADQLRVIAALAGDLGNGLVDLTNRANLQVRGLHDITFDVLKTHLGRAGLLPKAAWADRIRNIVADPLDGREPDALCDTRDLVSALDAAIQARTALRSLSSEGRLRRRQWRGERRCRPRPRYRPRRGTRERRHPVSADPCRHAHGARCSARDRTAPGDRRGPRRHRPCRRGPVAAAERPCGLWRRRQDLEAAGRRRRASRACPFRSLRETGATAHQEAAGGDHRRKAGGFRRSTP